MGIGAQIKKHNSMLKKLFLILALLPAGATVYLTVIFVLPGIKNPVSLLKFPRIRYVVFSFVLFLLWTFVVVLLVRLESHMTKQSGKGIVRLAGIINGVSLLWLLFSLIQSAAGFSGNVGIVSLSSAEELSYLRNYPSGEYVLTADIDMEEEQWKSIPKYEGSINGNGHSILNITIGKDGFIAENLGKISSLKLSNVQYTDFEPDEKFGALVRLNRGSVLSCAVFPASDKADPAANVLVGCSYGICLNNTGICYNRCEEHTYKLVSSTPADFFKHGTDSYRCAVCGDFYTSVAVSGQPIKLIASVILLLVSGFGVILLAFSYKGYKYAAIALLSIVALFMAFSFYAYRTVGVNTGKGETWLDRRIVKEEQTDPDQSDNTDSDEVDAELDWTVLEDYETYMEQSAQVVDESEKNGSIKKATEVSLFSTVVGNLASKQDVDCFSFTVAVKTDMKFHFSHQADVTHIHWDACIYGTDGDTVLNDGYIVSEETSEFGVSDLEPGTYYLKISNASGINPSKFSFSDAQYTITFIPHCVEHLNCTPYIQTRPTCTESGEMIYVCDDCRETVSQEKLEPLGHNWGKWAVRKEAKWNQIGERIRICSVCKETESESIWIFAWVIPFMVFALAVIVIGLLFFLESESSGFVVKRSERRRLLCLATLIAFALFVSTITGDYVLTQIPFGLSPFQINLCLAAFYCVNLLLIIGVLSLMFYKACLAAAVISSFLIAFLLLTGTHLAKQYALALAIIFGVLTLVNVILAYVARSDFEFGQIVFAAFVALIALGLTIFFGVKTKGQSGTVSASGVTQVQEIIKADLSGQTLPSNRYVESGSPVA